VELHLHLSNNFSWCVLEPRDNSLKNYQQSFTYFVYILSLLNIIAAIREEEEEEEKKEEEDDRR
jgi:hypothetical protein